MYHTFKIRSFAVLLLILSTGCMREIRSDKGPKMRESPSIGETDRETLASMRKDTETLRVYSENAELVRTIGEVVVEVVKGQDANCDQAANVKRELKFLGSALRTTPSPELVDKTSCDIVIRAIQKGDSEFYGFSERDFRGDITAPFGGTQGESKFQYEYRFDQTAFAGIKESAAFFSCLDPVALGRHLERTRELEQDNYKICNFRIVKSIKSYTLFSRTYERNEGDIRFASVVSIGSSLYGSTDEGSVKRYFDIDFEEPPRSKLEAMSKAPVAEFGD